MERQGMSHIIGTFSKSIVTLGTKYIHNIHTYLSEVVVVVCVVHGVVLGSHDGLEVSPLC